MTIKKLILTNTLYQLLAKFVSTFSTLIISVVITRYLGANTWGDYSIVISFVTLFYIFTEFGLNSIAAREFSYKKNITKEQFMSFFVIRLLITLFIVVIACVTLTFLNYERYINQAILFGLINLLLFSIASSFNVIFQAKLKYKYMFYSTIAFSITNLLVFLWVYQKYSGQIVLLVVPILVAELVRLAVSAFYAIKLIDTSASKFLNLKFSRYLFVTTIPLAGVLVFNTLMIQVDRLMLSVMVSSLYLGYYSLSYKLFDVLLVLPTFFMNAAFPIFSKRFKNNGEYSNEYTNSLIFLTLVGVIVTLLGLSVGWFFIPLIWGSSMGGAVISFNVLMLGSILFYISSIISWCFVVENKQKLLILVYASGFMCNLLLNLYIIPKYGYVGASVTTIITEALVLIMLEIMRRKYLSVKLVKINKLDLSIKEWKKLLS